MVHHHTYKENKLICEITNNVNRFIFTAVKFYEFGEKTQYFNFYEFYFYIFSIWCTDVKKI